MMSAPYADFEDEPYPNFDTAAATAALPVASTAVDGGVSTGMGVGSMRYEGEYLAAPPQYGIANHQGSSGADPGLNGRQPSSAGDAAVLMISSGSQQDQRVAASIAERDRQLQATLRSADATARQFG
jgi:hypothetical protein